MKLTPISQVSTTTTAQSANLQKQNAVQTKKAYAEAPNFTSVSNDKLTLALRALNGVQLAQTVSFKGFNDIYHNLRSEMKSCTDENGEKGEDAGIRLNVTKLMKRSAADMPRPYDSMHMTVSTSKTEAGEGVFNVVDTRMKVKRGLNDEFSLKAIVREPRPENSEDPGATANWIQKFDITQNPFKSGYQAFMLNTRGNLMGVIEDKAENVALLTNSGSIVSKNQADGALKMIVENPKNQYTPFIPSVPEVADKPFEPSIGKGAKLVISMQDGRYTAETMKAIADFVNKVKSGEIDFGPFVQAEGADKAKIILLAGGYGSRAEHANVASDRIFHFNAKDSSDVRSEKKLGQTNKGIVKSPTGLNSMETTFKTLHDAGILNCSKDALEIGKNIEFYINASPVNRGNGGFTLDVYKNMKEQGIENYIVVPNDAFSRMTNATKDVLNFANTGKSAMTMIAKEVEPKDAIKNLGIMKIAEDGEILGFAEKPASIPEGYQLENGKCASNTFQFSVNKDTFEALTILEDCLANKVRTSEKKESRDWSKCFTPIIMSITQNEDLEKIQKEVAKLLDTSVDNLPIEKIQEVKNILADKKVTAIPTSEPWVDAGTLNAYYQTAMQIASGDFKLSATERNNALKCINTETGLVTNSPELRAKIENKYDIKGEVVVVEKAPYLDDNAVKNEFKEYITYNK